MTLWSYLRERGLSKPPASIDIIPEADQPAGLTSAMGNELTNLCNALPCDVHILPLSALDEIRSPLRCPRGMGPSPLGLISAWRIPSKILTAEVGRITYRHHIANR